MEIDGVMLNISVSSGDNPSTLASLLATLTNFAPALTSLGTTAQSVGGVVYSNGRFASGVFLGDGISILVNPGQVLSSQKISEIVGGFTGILDDDGDFGRSSASLGDLDGDGIGDIAVGAPLAGGGNFRLGAVWILFLNSDGTVKSHQKIAEMQAGFTGDLDVGGKFGSSVASLGDLDGDGIADLAVGSRQDDDGGDHHGAVWVLFLNSDGTVKSHQKISDTQGGFTGTLVDGDDFGGSVASIPDLDGDGIGDLAVGAPGNDFLIGGPIRGAVWVLFLNSDGTVKSHRKIGDAQGGFTGSLDVDDRFGNAVASIGDLDGDGTGDLAVGADRDTDGGNNRGAVWVLFLNSDGTVKDQQKISDTQGEFAGLLDDQDGFGRAVASLGDIDGDGTGDIAVTAYGDGDGGIARGAVWMLFLNSDGTVERNQKFSDTRGGFSEILSNSDLFGGSVASLGDLDGDGQLNLVVGATRDDDGGGNHGAVYILSVDSGLISSCGDSQIALPETCDDGNITSGDGCYETCQIEDGVEFNGIAQGGTIIAEVSGTFILIVTTAGQDAATIASNLSDAINVTPGLQSQGISSVDLSNRVVSDGTFGSVVSNDPGITVPEPGFLVMLVVGVLALTALSNAKRARRRSARPLICEPLPVHLTSDQSKKPTSQFGPAILTRRRPFQLDQVC